MSVCPSSRELAFADVQKSPFIEALDTSSPDPLLILSLRTQVAWARLTVETNQLQGPSPRFL